MRPASRLAVIAVVAATAACAEPGDPPNPEIPRGEQATSAEPGMTTGNTEESVAREPAPGDSLPLPGSP